MTNISAIIKTNNSEDSICNLLESIKTFDEIIIIDENSKDDTIEIAKAYKTKVIYSLKEDIIDKFNMAIEEAQCEWIFLLDADEIIPKKLLDVIDKYIQKPKNKPVIKINQKTFYLSKELKHKRKQELRLFKKGCADIKSVFPYSINPLKKRIHKIKNKNNEFSILKYKNADIIENLTSDLERIKLRLKKEPSYKKGLMSSVLFDFLHFYFLKKAFLDGKRGFIFAYYKTLKNFLLNTAYYERENK